MPPQHWRMSARIQRGEGRDAENQCNCAPAARPEVIAARLLRPATIGKAFWLATRVHSRRAQARGSVCGTSAGSIVRVCSSHGPRTVLPIASAVDSSFHGRHPSAGRCKEQSYWRASQLSSWFSQQAPSAEDGRRLRNGLLDLCCRRACQATGNRCRARGLLLDDPVRGPQLREPTCRSEARCWPESG